MHRFMSNHSLRFSCQQCSLHELCLPLALSEAESTSLHTLITEQFIVKRHEKLFTEGDPFHYFYVVRSGSFKYVKQHPSPQANILGFYFAGDFFGFDAIVDDTYPATAIALEESSICAIRFDVLLDVTRKVPKLQRYLFNVMSRQTRDNLGRMLQHQSAKQRLALFFCKLSKGFQSRGYSATTFKLSMSRKDIANYLDLATETISRLLTTMQDEGLIYVNKKQVSLKNVKALENIVNLDSEAVALL